MCVLRCGYLHVRGGSGVTILIPDRLFDKENAIQRTAAAPVNLSIDYAEKLKDLSEEHWSAAAVLVAHYSMPYREKIIGFAQNARALIAGDRSIGDGNQLCDAALWPTSICDAGRAPAGYEVQRALFCRNPFHGLCEPAGRPDCHLFRHRDVAAVAPQLTPLDS